MLHRTQSPSSRLNWDTAEKNNAYLSSLLYLWPDRSPPKQDARRTVVYTTWFLAWLGPERKKKTSLSQRNGFWEHLSLCVLVCVHARVCLKWNRYAVWASFCLSNYKNYQGIKQFWKCWKHFFFFFLIDYVSPRRQPSIPKTLRDARSLVSRPRPQSGKRAFFLQVISLNSVSKSCSKPMHLSVSFILWLRFLTVIFLAECKCLKQNLIKKKKQKQNCTRDKNIECHIRKWTWTACFTEVLI